MIWPGSDIRESDISKILEIYNSLNNKINIFIYKSETEIEALYIKENYCSCLNYNVKTEKTTGMGQDDSENIFYATIFAHLVLLTKDRKEYTLFLNKELI